MHKGALVRQSTEAGKVLFNFLGVSVKGNPGSSVLFLMAKPGRSRSSLGRGQRGVLFRDASGEGTSP